MKVIIPMSGIGSRFAAAGYQDIKPLIQVDEKAIIQYVVEMFPKDSDFIFICNSEHLETIPKLTRILQDSCANKKIFGIEPHKLGPVHAVMQHLDEIDDDEEVIINYCDFCCDWDFDDFISFVRNNQLDGCIPSYKGFHPHTLWSNYYAYLMLSDSLITDIQEKTPFTDDPRNEYASSGTYYFKTGKLLKSSLSDCVSQGLSTNGEFYVSLAYKPMLANGSKVMPYHLNHFMQWGTPADLQEYEYHSRSYKLRQILPPNPQRIQGTKIVPMAGLGSRFSDQGYSVPKPLIDIHGSPMFLEALNMMPPHENNILITRDLNLESSAMPFLDTDSYSVIDLAEATDGQATTCLNAVIELENNSPFTIGACDNGMIYSFDKFQQALNSADVIVWSIRNYPGALRRPNMYGWLEVDANNFIKRVQVKKPFDSNVNFPIITGTFTFQNKMQYIDAYNRMLERKAMINGEYYVDELINDCIALGLKCISLEVESYLCWGTPEDLNTYLYWDECFKKWPSQ